MSLKVNRSRIFTYFPCCGVYWLFKSTRELKTAFLKTAGRVQYTDFQEVLEKPFVASMQL
jgi:hypothetical protein